MGERLMLSAERLRELLHYNKNTGDMIWICKSNYRSKFLGKIAGCKRKTREKVYVWIKIDGVLYVASRLAFLWVEGRWPEIKIDHKNGNSLDNRWSNLREANNSHNAWNRKIGAAGKALPMGVTMLPSGNFRARINKYRQSYNVGVFPTAELAELAYKEKRKEFFGEFA